MTDVNKPIQVTAIEEHEDGSATVQIECDPETFSAIFNVGFVTLVKAGLETELVRTGINDHIRPMDEAELKASKDREEANT